MPFKLATIERQRSVAGIVKAFYAVGNSPDLLRQGEEALLRANPFLADRDRLRPGVPLVVPDLPFLPSNPEAPPPAERAKAAERVALLQRLTTRTRDAGAAAKAETAAHLKLLDDPALRAVLGNGRPDLVPTLPDIAARVTARAEERDKRLQLVQDALKRARAGLKILDSLGNRS